MYIMPSLTRRKEPKAIRLYNPQYGIGKILKLMLTKQPKGYGKRKRRVRRKKRI